MDEHVPTATPLTGESLLIVFGFLLFLPRSVLSTLSSTTLNQERSVPSTFWATEIVDVPGTLLNEFDTKCR